MVPGRSVLHQCGNRGSARLPQQSGEDPSQRAGRIRRASRIQPISCLAKLSSLKGQNRTGLLSASTDRRGRMDGWPPVVRKRTLTLVRVRWPTSRGAACRFWFARRILDEREAWPAVTDCLLRKRFEPGASEYTRVGLLEVSLDLEDTLPPEFRWIADIARSERLPEDLVAFTIY